MEATSIYLSAARDYRLPAGKYEFVLYRGEDIIERRTGFNSKAAAQRAGIKAAQPYVAE